MIPCSRYSIKLFTGHDTGSARTPPAPPPARKRKGRRAASVIGGWRKGEGPPPPGSGAPRSMRPGQLPPPGLKVRAVVGKYSPAAAMSARTVRSVSRTPARSSPGPGTGTPSVFATISTRLRSTDWGAVIRFGVGRLRSGRIGGPWRGRTASTPARSQLRGCPPPVPSGHRAPRASWQRRHVGGGRREGVGNAGPPIQGRRSRKMERRTLPAPPRFQAACRRER